MASSLTNFAALHQDAQRDFMSNFVDGSAWWNDIASPIVGTSPEEITYTESDNFGLTTLSPQQESPSHQGLQAARASITADPYEEVIKIRNKDLRDNPRLFRAKAAELGVLARETLSAAMFDALTTLDVTAHPLSGVTGSPVTAQGGGTLFCADAYTVTTVDGVATNQSNVSTNALSRANIRTDISTHWSFVEHNGLRAAGFEARPFLVTPINLIATSDEITGLVQAIDVGGTIETPVAQHLKGHKVLPGAAADANDWWLIWSYGKRGLDGGIEFEGPIRPWVRSAPAITFSEDPGSHYTYLKVEMEYGIWYSLFCHLNTIFHKVA